MERNYKGYNSFMGSKPYLKAYEWRQYELDNGAPFKAEELPGPLRSYIEKLYGPSIDPDSPDSYLQQALKIASKKARQTMKTTLHKDGSGRTLDEARAANVSLRAREQKPNTNLTRAQSGGITRRNRKREPFFPPLHPTNPQLVKFNAALARMAKGEDPTSHRRVLVGRMMKIIAGVPFTRSLKREQLQGYPKALPWFSSTNPNNLLVSDIENIGVMLMTRAIRKRGDYSAIPPKLSLPSVGSPASATSVDLGTDASTTASTSGKPSAYDMEED